MADGDFFLLQWQLNDKGEWIDSRTEKVRPLPPADQHKRDWCACPLCHPDQWADPGYHEREMQRLFDQTLKTWNELDKG